MVREVKGNDLAHLADSTLSHLDEDARCDCHGPSCRTHTSDAVGSLYPRLSKAQQSYLKKNGYVHVPLSRIGLVDPTLLPSSSIVDGARDPADILSDKEQQEEPQAKQQVLAEYQRFEARMRLTEQFSPNVERLLTQVFGSG
jgi:hypothetical protein